MAYHLIWGLFYNITLWKIFINNTFFLILIVKNEVRGTNRPSYRRLQGTRLDSSKSIVDSEVRGKINHRERGTRDDSPKSIDRRQRGTRYDSPKLIVSEYDVPNT